MTPHGLRRVARDQRVAVCSAALFLVCLFAGFLAAALGGWLGEPASRALGIAAENGLALAIIGGFVGVVLLTGSLGYRTVDRVVLILLSLVPFLGVLVLLWTNERATRRLRAAGVPVGMLGVPLGAELRRRQGARTLAS